MARRPPDRVPTTCPACHAKAARPHCRDDNASHTCTWWACLKCKAYGDSTRWARREA